MTPPYTKRSANKPRYNTIYEQANLKRKGAPCKGVKIWWVVVKKIKPNTPEF